MDDIKRLKLAEGLPINYKKLESLDAVEKTIHVKYVKSCFHASGHYATQFSYKSISRIVNKRLIRNDVSRKKI